MDFAIFGWVLALGIFGKIRAGKFWEGLVRNIEFESWRLGFE
jgi:hypothetical protein